jgi:RNA polymerase sigma-70 factor, ECF subfamily
MCNAPAAARHEHAPWWAGALTSRAKEAQMSGADAGINAAMARYSAGDDGAFRELYEGLAPRLFRFLLRLSADRARAEDLLQQTFLQMHAARFRFLPGSDVVPWAMAIARRLFIDTVRERQRHATVAVDGQELDEAHSSPEPSAEEWVSAHEAATALDSRIARLPSANRDAFLLLKVEGLSLHDAAAILGITVSAVKVRAHRAYVRLREAGTRKETAR